MDGMVHPNLYFRNRRYAPVFPENFFRKQQEKEDMRDTAKMEETALVLKTLNAVGKLTVANTIALRDGKTNGETNAALSEYEHVEKKLYRYLVECHSEFVK